MQGSPEDRSNDPVDAPAADPRPNQDKTPGKWDRFKSAAGTGAKAVWRGTKTGVKTLFVYSPLYSGGHFLAGTLGQMLSYGLETWKDYARKDFYAVDKDFDVNKKEMLKKMLHLNPRTYLHGTDASEDSKPFKEACIAYNAVVDRHVGGLLSEKEEERNAAKQAIDEARDTLKTKVNDPSAELQSLRFETPINDEDLPEDPMDLTKKPAAVRLQTHLANREKLLGHLADGKRGYPPLEDMAHDIHHIHGFASNRERFWKSNQQSKFVEDFKKRYGQEKDFDVLYSEENLKLMFQNVQYTLESGDPEAIKELYLHGRCPAFGPEEDETTQAKQTLWQEFSRFYYNEEHGLNIRKNWVQDRNNPDAGGHLSFSFSLPIDGAGDSTTKQFVVEELRKSVRKEIAKCIDRAEQSVGKDATEEERQAAIQKALQGLKITADIDFAWKGKSGDKERELEKVAKDHGLDRMLDDLAKDAQKMIQDELSKARSAYGVPTQGAKIEASNALQALKEQVEPPVLGGQQKLGDSSNASNSLKVHFRR